MKTKGIVLDAFTTFVDTVIDTAVDVAGSIKP